MAKSKRPIKSNLTREEHFELVRKVDAYRAAHPEENAEDALQAVGYPFSGSVYYVWRARLGEAQPYGKGRPKVNGKVERADTVEFPLAIIPEKPKPAKRIARAQPTASRDEDKALAAQLLEVAAALLRR